MNKKWIGAVVGIGLVLTAAIGLKMGQKPLEVDMKPLEKGTIERYVEEVGELKLDQSFEVYTVASGRVIDSLPEIGDTVSKGQLLAQIDFQAAKLQMNDLEAQKRVVSAQYAAAKAPAKTSEVSRLNAQLRAAEAAYNEAKKNAEDAATLYQNGSISQSTYNQTTLSLAGQEAAVESAKSALALATEGISRQEREQYEAKLSEVDGQIALMKKQLKDLGIVSPIDGIILSKEAKTGQFVQAGKVLFEVGQPGAVHLRCDLLFEDLKDVKMGTLVVVYNDKLGVNGINGEVTKIYPVAFNKVSELGINQKRVTVEVSLTGNNQQLRPGYELTAHFVTQRKENVLLIDKKAVFDVKGTPAVFVSDNGKAVLKTIETGIENDDFFEVTKGLEEGALVVINPSEKLTEGMAIK